MVGLRGPEAPRNDTASKRAKGIVGHVTLEWSQTSLWYYVGYSWKTFNKHAPNNAKCSVVSRLCNFLLLGAPLEERVALWKVTA
jgi:hypothetical protein